MTILITGGTGRTATRLAKIIADHNVPVLLTSRKGPSAVSQPFKGVAFDWLDPATFANPFEADHTIDRVYLVAAPSINMRPFVDFAIGKGVKRFVLLSAILVEKGGIAHGKLHQFFEEESGLEWCVLRPSTFFRESCFFGYLSSCLVSRDIQKAGLLQSSRKVTHSLQPLAMAS